MAKYSKKYESWGGRELIAVINGKITGVKKDKANDTFFYRHPQTTGLAKKINLGRNKGKAAGKWWAIVEEHHKEQFQTLPTEQLKTRKIFHVKKQPHQTEEEFDAMVKFFVETATKQEDETLEEWNERVFDNPNLTSLVNKAETLVPEKVLAAIFNKWMEYPYECSKKLGREEIANLHKLSPKDPIKIHPMGQYYHNYENM